MTTKLASAGLVIGLFGPVACGGDDSIDLLGGTSSVDGGSGANGGAAGGTAEGCVAPADCEEGETCDLSRGECTQPCSATAPCSSGERPICDLVRQLCVECDSDLGCASGENPRCRIETGECVDCLNDADCSASHPSCVDFECAGG